MVKQTLRAFLLVALIGAFPLFADLVPIGPPLPYGSWVQSWSLSGIGAFDRLVANMLTSGVAFEDPGFMDVDAGGWPTEFASPSPWTATNTGGTAQVSKSGSAVNALDFFLHYSPNDPGSKAFKYEFTAYNGSDVVGHYFATWDKHDWTVATTATTVPEASTVVLRGGWLLGLGLLIVRRKAQGRRGNSLA